MKKILFILFITTFLFAKPPKMYNDALHEYRAKNYVKSEKIFNSFLKKYPDGVYTGNGFFWLGMLYYRQGQLNKAVLNFESVLTTKTTWKYADALFRLGLSYMKLKDYEAAEIILERIIKDYPDEKEKVSLAKIRLKKVKQKLGK